MKEDFTFSYRINDEVKRTEVLNMDEKKLLMGAIAYAKVRDYSENRKKDYVALMKKLNKVINGDRYTWRKK